MPKKCSVCGFDDFHETPTKKVCNLCGYTVYRRKAGKAKKTSAIIKSPTPTIKKDSDGAFCCSQESKENSLYPKYFRRKKPLDINELKKVEEKCQNQDMIIQN